MRREVDALTNREREVHDLLRHGLTNEEIAQRLGISLDGAKYHVSQILGKLGVESRAQAAVLEYEGRRPWWLHAAFWAKIGGAATVTATVTGLAVLTWGAVRSDGPADEVNRTGAPADEVAVDAVIPLGLPTPDPSAPPGFLFVSAGAGSIWVAHPLTDTVIRVDPETGEVLANIAIDPRPESARGSDDGEGGILATDDAIWVQDYDDSSLWRIDPATNSVVARLDLPSPPFGGHILEAFGSLWVPLVGGFTRIDPETNAVIGSFGLGKELGRDASASDMVTTSEAVWFTRWGPGGASPSRSGQSRNQPGRGLPLPWRSCGGRRRARLGHRRDQPG
jgi:DNA-binding CsgD family transcriptional regulator